jgi:hypothetical protein
MSHRLPSACLAALIVAGFGLSFAAAKPPDLPVDAKVTLKPFEPAAPDSPEQAPSPSSSSGSEEQAVPATKPAACPAKGTDHGPQDPQSQRCLARCLLMIVHPLMGLLPVDELIDDSEESEDAAPPEPQQTGSLMLGLDLDGDVLFAIQPEAGGPCYASPEVMFWQWCWPRLQPALADCPWWRTWTSGGAAAAPELLQQAAEARKLLHQADFYRRTGHPGSACFYYTMVRMRYPDTPAAEEARAQLGKLQADAGSEQEDRTPERAPVPSKQVPPQDETVCPYLMQQFGPIPQGKPIPEIYDDTPKSPDEGAEYAPTPPHKEECPPCQPKNKAKATEERLRSPTSLDITDAPLRQVLDDLRTAKGLNIVVDSLAVRAEGVDLNSALTIKLEDVATRTALELALRQVRLTYKVIDDGVILVTTETHSAGGKLVTRTYPVGDLLYAEDAVALRKALEQRSFKKNEIGPTPEDALIKLITRCIKCESWAEAGGPGTIDYFPLAAALVINQSPDVHERIGQLLQELRRSQQAAEKAVEDQDRTDPEDNGDKATPEEGNDEVRTPTTATSVARLLRRSHQALAAGRQEEAARLVQKALDLDTQAVAGDPLVYKLGLLHQVRHGQPAARPFLTPGLPPADPGVVPALQQILVRAGAAKKELVLTVDETDGAKQEPAGIAPCCATKTKAAGAACWDLADQVRQFLCAEVDMTAEHCRGRCEMHVGDCVLRLRWDGEHCAFSLETATAGADRCEPVSK